MNRMVTKKEIGEVAVDSVQSTITDGKLRGIGNTFSTIVSGLKASTASTEDGYVNLVFDLTDSAKDLKTANQWFELYIISKNGNALNDLYKIICISAALGVVYVKKVTVDGDGTLILVDGDLTPDEVHLTNDTDGHLTCDCYLEITGDPTFAITEAWAFGTICTD